MGWGNDDEQQTPVSQASSMPVYYGPMFNPYQMFEGLPSTGAESLLGGSTVPQTNSPGFVPTSGWAGTGNADVIPGAAMQLLRMAQSPMYTWR